MSEIIDKYTEILSRPKTAFYAFSDVFPPHGRQEVPDFDAVLTTEARSLAPRANLSTFGIGQDPQTALHAASLLVDLQTVRGRRIQALVSRYPESTDLPSHIIELRQEFESTTPHAILNVAPRSVRTGLNGTDFHLAITDNGVALWTTPLQLLERVATSRRITALFRVPNRDNPVFPNGEQFRSSVVPAFRFYPETLLPVFQYESRADLLQAIADGGEIPLPIQREFLKTAWPDEFGNVRATTPRLAELQEQIQCLKSSDNVVGVRVAGYPLAVLAQVRTHLSEIDDGELGIFVNPADEEFSDGRWQDPSGTIELVRKVREPSDPAVLSAQRILSTLQNGKSAKTGTSLEIVDPSEAISVKEILRIRNRLRNRCRRLFDIWQQTRVT